MGVSNDERGILFLLVVKHNIFFRVKVIEVMRYVLTLFVLSSPNPRSGRWLWETLGPFQGTGEIRSVRCGTTRGPQPTPNLSSYPFKKNGSFTRCVPEHRYMISL